MKQENTKPKSRLWLWVTAAFVALISCWAWLIVTAVKNSPEKVRLEEVPGG